MRPEDYIRRKIRQLLIEASIPTSNKKTSRVSGGVRKEFRDLKARSENRPRDLMKDLGVTSVKSRENKYEVLHDLLGKAIAGNEIMGDAYSRPEYIKDEFGRQAAMIKVVGDIASRDGVFFIRHTLRGAKNAKMMPFNDKVAVELLGDNIILYITKKPYSWNQPQREEKPPEKEGEEDSTKEKEEEK